MSSGLAFLLVLALAAAAYTAAHRRAMAFPRVDKRQTAHSRPGYHGWQTALAALAPALLLLLVWNVAGPGVIEAMTVNVLDDQTVPAEPEARRVFLDEVRGLATGAIADSYDENAKAAAAAYKHWNDQAGTLVGAAALAVGLLGALASLLTLKPHSRTRNRVERLMMALLVAASTVAIVTTLGIVLSLLFESLRFFNKIPLLDFLLGTKWSPQTALRADQVGSSGAFGAIPLFWGTIFIALIAMVVAVPIGLFSAVYLTQYATPTLRRWMKPMLEVLAGVPTVVYGYFAALTLAPAVRQFAECRHRRRILGKRACGWTGHGVMIIPFMSSMADDALTAVPQAMKDGSLAMGATLSETIRKVLMPAALPGIVGGFLLAVSRAIGETMIVVMAAGLAANLTANPFASVTTVTAQIVQLLTGDQEFDSPRPSPRSRWGWCCSS
ncbi:phosphate ABC transporter permease subunit PstC [Hankyongella ginsenosidimutans]|uniref:phosphate ABC transporter permease subunit PstC n=1 Tax=Hankyongella ginsenosidimutans TaxID=1763828 RepID=UPI001FE5EDBF|nr:phosphate ABC transporter permease subunit PstC [Hankyongella ginsenosidimutans]